MKVKSLSKDCENPDTDTHRYVSSNSKLLRGNISHTDVPPASSLKYHQLEQGIVIKVDFHRPPSIKV